ncbi:MAG: ATP-binding cassette domain-containing protein [Desulfobacterales bacterium]
MDMIRQPERMKHTPPLIRLFHVCKRFEKKNALVDVTLDILKNEFVFICGPSGAGKSTLLKLLFLGEPVSEGQIIVDGINLSRIPRKKIPYLRRDFGIIFQDFKLIPTKTVFENVALVLEAKGKSGKTAQKKVKSVLRFVDMEKKQHAYPPTLSGGEQQRVAVARAVAGDPKIILADEPTGSLDTASADVIITLLRRFHSRGATVITATHDESLVEKIGGRILRLENGRIGSADDVSMSVAT